MRQQYCSGKQKRKLLQFQMKPGLIMLIIFANYSKSTIILHRLNIEKNKDYIRCEMTPTSAGGEQQISISGGSQSPI